MLAVDWIDYIRIAFVVFLILITPYMWRVHQQGHKEGLEMRKRFLEQLRGEYREDRAETISQGTPNDQPVPRVARGTGGGNAISISPFRCPQCGGEDLKKHGSASVIDGKRGFKCQDCGLAMAPSRGAIGRAVLIAVPILLVPAGGLLFVLSLAAVLQHPLHMMKILIVSPVTLFWGQGDS